MKKLIKFIFPNFKKDIIKLITPIIPKNFLNIIQPVPMTRDQTNFLISFKNHIKTKNFDKISENDFYVRIKNFNNYTGVDLSISYTITKRKSIIIDNLKLTTYSENDRLVSKYKNKDVSHLISDEFQSEFENLLAEELDFLENSNKIKTLSGNYSVSKLLVPQDLTVIPESNVVYLKPSRSLVPSKHSSILLDSMDMQMKEFFTSTEPMDIMMREALFPNGFKGAFPISKKSHLTLVK